MKTFYAGLTLFIGFFVLPLTLLAQTPTVLLSSSDCNFVRNFNTNDEGFTSPSIYADDENVEFFYNNGIGAWVETSGLTSRDGSLISPPFLNTSNGSTVVGFTYSAPAGTQFRIRVISVNGPLEILATTATGPVWDNLPSTNGTVCYQLVDADITLGAVIRYEISFRANGAESVLFDNFAINTAEIPLPVTFMGFISKRNDDGSVKLLWNVADEVDVQHYVVERSLDGVNFSSIGTVTATGKSNYSFNDNAEVSRTRYYRVRNVDIDGRTKSSNVVKVLSQVKTGNISLYPVPARNELFVQHDKAAAGSTVTVISFEGQVVKRVRPETNSLQTYLNISTLKAGTYIVQYNDNMGTMKSVKFVKP